MLAINDFFGVWKNDRLLRRELCFRYQCHSGQRKRSEELKCSRPGTMLAFEQLLLDGWYGGRRTLVRLLVLIFVSDSTRSKYAMLPRSTSILLLID